LFLAAKTVVLIAWLVGVTQSIPAHWGRAGLLFAAFAILFAATVVGHEIVLRRTRFAQALRRINQDEAAALSGSIIEDGPTGEEFLSLDHVYAPDLDLFGRHSVFHLVGRAVTSLGQRALADLFLGPLEARQIKIQQDAVRELAPKLPFRQTVRAHGAEIADTSAKLETLSRLFHSSSGLPDLGKWKIFLFGLPLLTLALLVLAFINIPWPVFAGFFLLQWLINALTGKRVAAFYGSTSRHFRLLKAYADIIREIEREPFSSPGMIEIQNALTADGRTASRAIRKLASRLEWLDARANKAIHFFLNNLVFWDLHCVRLIEAWRSTSAARVGGWFAAIGRTEALSSLANLSFNNPGWAFPRIVESGFELRASALGHPLIPSEERTVNDYAQEPPGGVDIITGPNMAGKSTFLRTVGVNAVLAFAGSPVCAADMSISPFGLATSMKTSDTLDKKMSLFYAELLRLKMILDDVRKGRPVFFMIDEMLKGTNAMDRHTGSVALVRQLLRTGANGIVATHDIELTHLSAERPNVRNFHFDSFVGDGLIDFDFKLRPGVCESFNALALMKSMGFEV
jgi:DNA mismatch repair ATPase MutS